MYVFVARRLKSFQAELFLYPLTAERLPAISVLTDITKPEGAEFSTMIKTDEKYSEREKYVRKNVTLLRML